MTYLERRIEHLLRKLEEGKVRILDTFAASETGNQLLEDLSNIARQEDGSIDLSTCSPLARSVAKALFAMEHYDLVKEPSASEPQEALVDLPEVSRSMKEYFRLLEEFFIEATGTKPTDFEFEAYRSRLLANIDREGESARKAFENYPPRIAKFHSQNTALLYRSAGAIGGLKCVLGGSSRFPKAAFDGVRKFALYSDTIFIPDPLLPWLEVERVEERFALINFLRNCHQLLLLKPLVEADISYPAIVVFPSWEKSFELHDVEAKDGISQLILGFFSYYLGASFEDESELAQYIQGSGSTAFEEAVTKQGLFWPPEESGPLPFGDAFSKYQIWLRQWRSKEWLEEIDSLSPHLLVLNGIIERLTPQFHVRDNASYLDAQPLFWLSPHFHYYQLASTAGNSILNQTGLLDNSTFASLQNLLHPEVAWLGNIPIADLAKLREENANEKFRGRLRLYVDELAQMSIDDLNVVSGGVIRGLQSLLDEHDREVKHILEHYERNHMHTLAASVLTLAASLYPWLEPWIGLTVLAPMLKASYDVIDQFRAERTLSRSLTGILSEAHGAPNKR